MLLSPKNSLHHNCRLIDYDQKISKQPSIKYSVLKKLVTKIIQQRQALRPRRISAYGQLFGELTTKQRNNLPITVEYHKQMNSKEIALNSFAGIFERKFSKPIARRLTRKLSKQESFVEHDNMERPPSSVTPKKKDKVQVKKKTYIQKENAKYFNQQDVKLTHYLSRQFVPLTQRNMQLHSPSTQSYASYQQITTPAVSLSLRTLRKITPQHLESPKQFNTSPYSRNNISIVYKQKRMLISNTESVIKLLLEQKKKMM